MFRGVCTSIALATSMLAPAWAQDGPTTVPNGPNGDNDSLSSLRSYEQLVQALESSVKTSQGAATLHDAHWTSNSGRKVPYVVIGNGPTAVMIVAQQHGDEMETSDSAVNFVRTLSNNSMDSRTIRAALTVIVVPRVNVDGFDGKKADGTPLTNATGTQVPPWRENWDTRFTTNRGGIGTKSGGYIQKIGLHASLAIVRELAKDPTLMAFPPEQADILVVPANGEGPRQGPGEAIEEGYVPGVLAEADDFHLGN